MSTTASSVLTRRHMLQLFGTVGMGAALAACAGPGSGSKSPQGVGAPDTSGPITGKLSFAHWRGEDRKVFAEIIDDFVAEHDGTKVSQDISPSQDYQRTALQRVRGGAVGDVFTASRGAQFEDMVKAELFADLTDLPAKKGYQPKYLEWGQANGSQLGLPYQVVFNMPIVNMDLMERIGVTEQPKSWDAFLAMLEKLKSLDVVPLIFPGGSAADYNQLLHSMVMNNAPSDDMFTKIQSGEYKCTDDWYLKTLENYAELRPYLQPNFTGTQAEAAQRMFAGSEAAMMVTGSYYIAVMRELGAKFPIDVMAPITVPEDEVKYEGIYNAAFIIGINSASDNQATATAFVEYLSDPEVAGVYANGTAQHVTVEGVEYTDPDLAALEPWLTRETLIAPAFQFTNLDIRSAVENAAFAVIAGKKKPDQAAEEAQRIVDQNL